MSSDSYPGISDRYSKRRSQLSKQNANRRSQPTTKPLAIYSDTRQDPEPESTPSEGSLAKISSQNQKSKKKQNDCCATPCCCCGCQQPNPCCLPCNPGPGMQETMCYNPKKREIYQAPCQIGVIPMRSAAFQAPCIPLPKLCERVLNNDDDCCGDEEEDGVQFEFKPKKNCRTEVTFTIEPKTQPPWLTMLNCGFKPMVNCSAPPCYLSPNGNPGTDFFGGTQSFVNKAFGTQMNYGGLANFPTLEQIKNAFPKRGEMNAKPPSESSEGGSGSEASSSEESSSSEDEEEAQSDKIIQIQPGIAPPPPVPQAVQHKTHYNPDKDHHNATHRDPRIQALVERGFPGRRSTHYDDHDHHGTRRSTHYDDHDHHDARRSTYHHHHHHHHRHSADNLSRSSDWHP